MSIFDKLFGKKSAETVKKTYLPTDADRELLAQCVERMRSHARASIAYRITDREPGPFESKIGGAYCLPEGMDVPEAGGEKLAFLAQLNLTEQPELEGFPTRGLLQFFIADDDDYGLDGVCVCVRYLPEIPESGHYTVVDEPSEELPFEGSGCFALKPSRSLSLPGIEAYEYAEILRTEMPELLDERGWFKNPYLDEAFYETLTSLPDEDIAGTRMGGYADFVQWDPREKGEYDTLLFQLDSDMKHVCWGDCGVGNFFISKEKLAQLDFSDVLFNWDCG